MSRKIEGSWGGGVLMNFFTFKLLISDNADIFSNFPIVNSVKEQIVK